MLAQPITARTRLALAIEINKACGELSSKFSSPMDRMAFTMECEEAINEVIRFAKLLPDEPYRGLAT